jgi:hypothetical protein
MDFTSTNYTTIDSLDYGMSYEVSLLPLFNVALFAGLILFAIYGYLLIKRVQILSDTIYTPYNAFVTAVVGFSVIGSIVAGVIAILIL